MRRAARSPASRCCNNRSPSLISSIKPHSSGAPRVDRLAGEDEPRRPPGAHETRQQRGLDHRRDAEPDFGHGEFRALGGDAQVAGRGDLQARADHRAVQLRDHRNRQIADRLADAVNSSRQTRPRCSAFRLFSSLSIRAAAERASATREHRDSQGFVFLETSKGVPQLPEEGRIQSVCFFRPVEEDSGHRTFALHIHHAFILQPRGFEKSLDCDPDHRAVQARVAQRVHPGDFSPEPRMPRAWSARLTRCATSRRARTSTSSARSRAAATRSARRSRPARRAACW